MMAAIAANDCGAQVVLLEQNEKLGKKMYISGKGRCNLTNDCAPRDFLQNVVRNPKFLLGAINKFSPQDAQNFCIDNGLPLKTERGGRVFPCSDKSSDVLKFFATQLAKRNVEVRLNTTVCDIVLQENTFLLHTMTDIVVVDRVIIATGGKSYSATGSTGDGYKFARKFGHEVVELKPALCRLLCKDTSSLEWLSLRNVTLSLVDSSGKTVASQFGELLFTDDGISGPCALSLSSEINRASGKYICIDLKPALSCDKLDERILRDFSERMNRDFINALDGLLPARLVGVVAKQSGIPFEQKVNSITVEQRHRLVGVLKQLRFAYVGTDDIEHGIVTSGGVNVAQINPSTMESRLQKGLYWAGEVVDVDAFTGGFNIQIALSTGYVAGCSAAK